MRHILLLPLLWAAIAVCQTAPAPSATDLDRQCKSILEQAFSDKNPDTRKQAAIALSLIGSNNPFHSQLESLLDDKDVEVRLASVASITDLKTSQTIPELHKALNDPVPEVSFAAARSLWALNDPDGKKALLSILSGETKASSGYFATQKRDALRMMHTPKTAFLFAVKTGASFAPVPGLGAGVASAQGLLSDPSVSGRAATALLLEKDQDPETTEAMKEALHDKDWSVRAAAVHALVLRDDPAFETGIIPLLDDKTEAVRLRAAAGYLRLEAIKNAPKPETTKPHKRPVRKTTPKPQVSPTKPQQ